jgi:diketogulonate reductase-like aldo/keto reductase
MPVLGLGTWRSPKEMVSAAVQAALKVGYRHIDCARVYQNEAVIGKALAASLTETKTLKRSDVFITSKLWNHAHAAKNVEEQLRTTLADLQLDYLDLYLIHWPAAFAYRGRDELFPKESKEDDAPYAQQDTAIKETWRAMELMVTKGLVRSIGVSNFTKEQVADVVSYQKVPCSINQVEAHPFLPQTELQQACAAAGIHITAYSPLGNLDVKKIAQSPLKHATVAKIAAAHKKTAAQVLIRWSLQTGTHALPIIILLCSVSPSCLLFVACLSHSRSTPHEHNTTHHHAQARFASPRRSRFRASRKTATCLTLSSRAPSSPSLRSSTAARASSTRAFTRMAKRCLL